MRLKAILLAAFALITVSATAQDKIYKKNGDVIEGKVKEVNSKNISYKRWDNPEGPDYVIGRNEVQRIKYQNGSEDYMAPEREGMTKGTAGRKPAKKIEYGSNIISAALINLSDDGFGVGLAYERALDKKGIINFYLPVNMCFSSIAGNEVYNPTTGTYDYNMLSRRVFQIMPGVKFYPTGNQGKVRYGIAAQLAYYTGTKEVEQYLYSPLYSSYYQTGNAQVQKLGILVNNSLNMFPTAHVFIGIDLGLGLTYMNKEENLMTGKMQELGTAQLAQFNFRIGYRF
ncbi:MAG TPA: hypothetical protein VEB40_02940 [Flavipsychrobacter sp.]|nr:hypothetical protein [Flavipsychrobacter sp.]